ncbi:MAG: LapA family protein [Leptospiraceae bacterium]|nr:LapA family protein [Leptospiraceae bacterium]MDW8305876.1 LapA family protein [Leptospiraceae bacterium]
MSLTIVLLVAFCILLLSNFHEVEFRFFLITFRIPLMYVITFSAALGVLLSLLFMLMASGYRRLKLRLDKLKER